MRLLETLSAVVAAAAVALLISLVASGGAIPPVWGGQCRKMTSIPIVIKGRIACLSPKMMIELPGKP